MLDIAAKRIVEKGEVKGSNLKARAVAHNRKENEIKQFVNYGKFPFAKR